MTSDMPEGWRSAKLKDLVILHRDTVDPALMDDPYVDHYSIPAFDAGRSDRVVPGTIKSNKLTVPDSAILVSRLNPRIPRVWEPRLGEGIPALCSTEFAVLTARDGTDKRFLKYLALSQQVMGRMQELATGTSGSHQRVKPNDLLAIDTHVPPLREQQAIAEMLGALDDRIESNRKTSQDLDDICRTQYDQLSASAVEWSPIVELMEFNPPIRLARGSTYPFVEMAAVAPWDPVPSLGSKSYTGSGARFEVGDTLMARITPSLEHGKTAFIAALPEATAGFGSTEFITARAKSGFGAASVFYLLRTDRVRGHAIANMSGSSGRQRVPVDCFDHFNVPSAPAGVLLRFESLASGCLLRMTQLRRESETIERMRETLLPRLLSGELRIQVVERLVEDLV